MPFFKKYISNINIIYFKISHIYFIYNKIEVYSLDGHKTNHKTFITTIIILIFITIIITLQCAIYD